MEKITSFKEYTNLAIKTLKKLPTEQQNKFHMYSGMQTELGELLDPIKKHVAYDAELDFVNLKEEIGDFCWYVACNIHLGSEIEEVKNRHLHLVDRTIKASLMDINRSIPKWPLKEKSWKKNKQERQKDEVLLFLTNMTNSLRYDSTDIHLMIMVCKMFKFDFFEVLSINIEKLQKRYGEKFSEEKANKRDLKEERKTLESKEDKQ